MFRIFRAVWNSAREDDEDLGECPTSRLSRTRTWFRSQRRTEVVPFADLPKFFEAAGTIENRVHGDLVLLMLFTGLRRGEACALSWREVDLDKKTLTLAPERTKSSHKLTFPHSGLGGSSN